MNLFMTFKFGDDPAYPMSFGYIISEKAFGTFVTGNLVRGSRLVEEDITFPPYLMHGSTRRVLMHYIDDKPFSCFVPVFPTDEEVDNYRKAFT